MKKTYAFNEEVACDFVEPDKNDQLGGLSPKFNCKLANGDIVKVNISAMAAMTRFIQVCTNTRVQWLMGMPTDAVFPVRVTCRNCPDKWAAYVDSYVTSKAVRLLVIPGPRATRKFPCGRD